MSQTQLRSKWERLSDAHRRCRIRWFGSKTLSAKRRRVLNFTYFIGPTKLLRFQTKQTQTEKRKKEKNQILFYFLYFLKKFSIADYLSDSPTKIKLFEIRFIFFTNLQQRKTHVITPSLRPPLDHLSPRLGFTFSLSKLKLFREEKKKKERKK